MVAYEVVDGRENRRLRRRGNWKWGLARSASGEDHREGATGRERIIGLEENRTGFCDGRVGFNLVLGRGYRTCRLARAVFDSTEVIRRSARGSASIR